MIFTIMVASHVRSLQAVGSGELGGNWGARGGSGGRGVGGCLLAVCGVLCNWTEHIKAVSTLPCQILLAYMV